MSSKNTKYGEVMRFCCQFAGISYALGDVLKYLWTKGYLNTKGYDFKVDYEKCSEEEDGRG